MEIIEIKENSVELNITLNELVIFQKSLREALGYLGPLEFKIILGFKFQKIEIIFDSIKKAMDTATNEAKIELSNRDIIDLKQILNKVNNFESSIGVPEQEAQKLLSGFSDLANLVRQKNTVKVINKKSGNNTKPDKKTKPEIRKKCRLKCQKYDLFFYMKNLDFYKDKLKFIIVLKKSGTDEFITQANPQTILIYELEKFLISLRNQINSFNRATNTSISCSFPDQSVKINIDNAELNSSNSSEETEVRIEFILKEKEPIDPRNEYANFATITTLNNIEEFITSVENVLMEILCFQHGVSSMTDRQGGIYYRNIEEFDFDRVCAFLAEKGISLFDKPDNGKIFAIDDEEAEYEISYEQTKQKALSGEMFNVNIWRNLQWRTLLTFREANSCFVLNFELSSLSNEDKDLVSKIFFKFFLSEISEYPQSLLGMVIDKYGETMDYNLDPIFSTEEEELLYLTGLICLPQEKFGLVSMKPKFKMKELNNGMVCASRYPEFFDYLLG